MHEIDGSHVGRRIRDIRSWRDVSLRATAELAGISPSYLSLIENAERPLQKRSTLEAIARALRVSPTELGALPTAGVLDPAVAKALDHLVEVENALTDVLVGEQTVVPRPWPAVAADVDRLCSVLGPRADIAGQMAILPTLIRELNALHGMEPQRRAAVLEALMLVYDMASLATQKVGARSAPGLATTYMREVAEMLDQPRWIGLARFARARSLGSGNRRRSRELSALAADEMQSDSSDVAVRQLYGMLHLTSALASAALDDPDGSESHLREARDAAGRTPTEVEPGWVNLSFSETNVQFWEVALTIELGEPGKVPELAEDIHPEKVASWSRQGAYYADLGRALATTKGRADEAVTALVRAESLAPVSTRANVWTRETVSDLLRRVKRDAPTGRELRGMAYRMGLAA
jgi:transcriptional regulator with XRE-family HTH domain